jgi:hypothetical protein
MNRRLLPWICATMFMAGFVGAILPAYVSAQEKKFEIAGTYSYMWAGSFEGYEGEIRLEDGGEWGGSIDFAFRPDAMIELSYSNSASHATFQRYVYGVGSTPSLDNIDNPVTIQYFQLGSIYQVPKGKAQPFIGLHLGAALFHPSGSVQGLTLEDKWSFAASLTGGVKIYMSEKFGLRMQGRLLLPMYFSGGGVFVGTGGASVGVSAGIPIVQGDIGAGIFVCL